MDIIIKNGVIQHDESKRIRDIKNNEGLLKKNYADYVKGTPGPYYDLCDCHIHVPRFPKDIPNFHGPQNSKKIKIDFNDEYSNSMKYCCICHILIKTNTSFPAKRRYFESITYDEYRQIDADKKVYKSNIEYSLKWESFYKKLSIKNETNSKSKRIIKWNLFYNKLNRANYLRNLNYNLEIYKTNQIKILSMYYKLLYKLLKQPIYYTISPKETKILWPWELTSYQKFKLLNPEYRSSVIFGPDKLQNFRTNYIIIE